jgi:hypothetical protein
MKTIHLGAVMLAATALGGCAGKMGATAGHDGAPPAGTDAAAAPADAAADLPAASPDAGGAGGGGGGAGGSGDGDAGGSGGGDAGGAGGGPATPTVVETVDITDVWSGHPVAFSLITTGNQQLAAFFDQNRAMTVAQRALGDATFRLVRLPTMLGWDSHNYVTMAVDGGGFVHVSGNMHNVPLIYFRSTAALDIATLAAASMVGTDENSATYPVFLQSPAGDLFFDYRNGGSGAGDTFFDKYNLAARTWSRLPNNPLLDGEGARNAYPVGPVLGPDGYYHLVWVWRDTPDASTNHDLSYAKSRDLVTWQTSSGRTLALPIKLSTGEIVDPVPVNGGIVNNNTKVGFDDQNRPVIAYHKYDAAGNTQLYNARLENGRWVVHQTSDWTTRWTVAGMGTLVFQVQVEELHVQRDGTLTEEWYNSSYGGWGAFRLDPTTLQTTATIDPPRPYPRALDTPESTTAGMVVRWAQDSGKGPDPQVLYMLRWETLESNNDMPRATIPPPTRLRLLGVRQPQ